MCMCLSVCYHIFGDIVHLYVATTIAKSFVLYAPDFYKRDFSSPMKKLRSQVMASFLFEVLTEFCSLQEVNSYRL